MQTLHYSSASSYILAPTRDVGDFRAKLAKFNGKPKRSPIRPGSRAFPKFTPGQSTADYVRAFEMLNHSNFHAIEWAQLNNNPCALYSGSDSAETLPDGFETWGDFDAAQCAPDAVADAAEPAQDAANDPDGPSAPDPAPAAPSAAVAAAPVDVETIAAALMARAMLERYGVSTRAAAAAPGAWNRPGPGMLSESEAAGFDRAAAEHAARIVDAAAPIRSASNDAPSSTNGDAAEVARIAESWRDKPGAAGELRARAANMRRDIERARAFPGRDTAAADAHLASRAAIYCAAADAIDAARPPAPIEPARQTRAEFDAATIAAAETLARLTVSFAPDSARRALIERGRYGAIGARTGIAAELERLAESKHWHGWRAARDALEALQAAGPGAVAPPGAESGAAGAPPGAESGAKALPYAGFDPVRAAVYRAHCETAKHSRAIDPAFSGMLRRPRSAGFMADFLAPDVRAHRNAIAAAVRADRAARLAVPTAPPGYAYPGPLATQSDPVDLAELAHAAPATLDGLTGRESEPRRMADVMRAKLGPAPTAAALIDAAAELEARAARVNAIRGAEYRDAAALLRAGAAAAPPATDSGPDPVAAKVAECRAAIAGDPRPKRGIELQAAQLRKIAAGMRDGIAKRAASDDILQAWAINGPRNDAAADALEAIAAEMPDPPAPILEHSRHDWESWAAIGSGDAEPDAYRAHVLECYGAARAQLEAAGRYPYNADAWPLAAAMMAERYGYPDAREHGAPDGVARAFGSNCYSAGQILSARAQAAAMKAAADGLKLGPLPVLIFNDGKRCTGAVLESFTHTGSECRLSFKRGRSAFTATCSASQLVRAIERGAERAQHLKDKRARARPAPVASVAPVDPLAAALQAWADGDAEPAPSAPPPVESVPLAGDSQAVAVDIFVDGFGFYWYALPDGTRWTGRPSFAAAAAELEGMGMQGRDGGHKAEHPAAEPVDAETLRADLRRVESAILATVPARFSVGGGDIEAACRHRAAPADLKRQRADLRAKLRAERAAFDAEAAAMKAEDFARWNPHLKPDEAAGYQAQAAARHDARQRPGRVSLILHNVLVPLQHAAPDGVPTVAGLESEAARLDASAEAMAEGPFADDGKHASALRTRSEYREVARQLRELAGIERARLAEADPPAANSGGDLGARILAKIGEREPGAILSARACAVLLDVADVDAARACEALAAAGQLVRFDYSAQGFAPGFSLPYVAPAAPAENPRDPAPVVQPYRYSRGAVVAICQSVDGYKTRGARLAEHCRMRYVGRAGGYVGTVRQSEKLLRLFAEGRDASAITGELYPPEAHAVAPASADPGPCKHPPARLYCGHAMHADGVARPWVACCECGDVLTSGATCEPEPLPADVVATVEAMPAVDAFDYLADYSDAESRSEAAREPAAMRAAVLDNVRRTGPEVFRHRMADPEPEPAPLDGLDVVELGADGLAEFERAGGIPWPAPIARAYSDARAGRGSGPPLRIPATDPRARIPARFAPVYCLRGVQP